MERFPPSGGLIATTVTFSKLQYAQLRALRLYPPKPFRLPPSNTPDYLAYELGMKLVRSSRRARVASRQSPRPSHPDRQPLAWAWSRVATCRLIGVPGVWL